MSWLYDASWLRSDMDVTSGVASTPWEWVSFAVGQV